MQIIYAAPFILLSLICFAVSLAVPYLRRFAVPALVAPVAFGFCSLASWVTYALLGWKLLHLHANPGYLPILEGVLFYALPGSLGAWLTVKIIRSVERSFLKTQKARILALSTIVSCIGAGVGFVVGLGVADHVLPVD